MGFSRQEYWSGFSCPSPGGLPKSRIEPTSPTAPVLHPQLTCEQTGHGGCRRGEPRARCRIATGAVTPDAFNDLDYSTWERAMLARCPQHLLSFKTNLQEKCSEAEGCSEGRCGKGVSETLRLLTAPSRASWSALALAAFSLHPLVHRPAGGRTLGVETRGWKGRGRAESRGSQGKFADGMVTVGRLLREPETMSHGEDL